MKIAVISASHRNLSKSGQAALWVCESLNRHELESDLFDLSQIHLDFWSEDLWNKSSSKYDNWRPYSERLKACDGLVVVSPEWAGMTPPKLTNFFLHCSAQELSYKPALLIGISAGMSGTYPIVSLRASSSKNNQMVFLPDHLIIRNANTFFAPKENEEKGSVLDPDSHHALRLHYNLKILKAMAKDLAAIRSSIDLTRYPFGL